MKRQICFAAAIVPVVSAVHGRAASIGDVFVIALENHDFTQPSGDTSPQQIKGNAAAPFLNSLITPGNANAADVSYAADYTNSGTGVHPSEPNYIWDEAGTNYNPATGATILGDNDPTAGNKNIFTTPHLAGLMNAAGVSWKTYQEDYQISGQGPTVSASGTLPGGAVNPYNGSTLYGYAVKHDPTAFFSDTALQNVHPIAQLGTDLTGNSTGQYNWITPDLYNDMHSSLSAGFTYHGTHYTGDQSAIAAGDNFLSIVVPQIEASAAFKNNGVIIIWDDESEGGDTTEYTVPEIVISPLAKGNAYASGVPLNHSSDLKTMQEIFGLGPTYLNNAIPTAEYSPAGGAGTFNTVAASNDLGDLFQPGVIRPLPAVWSGGIGNWSVATSWAGGAVPNDPTIEVRIDHGNAAASVVTLNQNASVADVVLDNHDTLAVNPGQSLTLNGPATTAVNGTLTVSGKITAAAVAVSATGSFNLSSSGSFKFNGTFTNAGNVQLNGVQNWSAGSTFDNSAGTAMFTTDAGAGGSNLIMNVAGGNVILGTTQHLAELKLGTGAVVSVNSTSRSVLVTPVLSVSGTLDLVGNDLDLQTGCLQTVTNLVAAGFNLAAGGNWAGTGITSSTAAADPSRLTALGVIQNNQGGTAVYAAVGSFDGVTPGTGDILAKCTYFGDANLDGKIDGSDYTLIDAGYASHGNETGWYNGDFNYDGVIDGSDYALIDNDFNNQSPPIHSTTLVATDTSEAASAFATVPVPEPSVGALLACALAVRRRRRAG